MEPITDCPKCEGRGMPNGCPVCCTFESGDTYPYGTQVGGSHYTKHAIQPMEFILANGLGFAEGNVIKYVVRYQDKNGVEDLKKARHYLDMLINQLEK